MTNEFVSCTFISAMYPSPTIGAVKGEIVDFGTDRNAYRVGDMVRAWITIKNTGDQVIDNGVVKWKVEKGIFNKSGETNIKELINDFKVAPGQTRRFEKTQKLEVPGIVPGFIIDGVWNIKADLYVGNAHIGHIEKNITLKK